MRWRGGRVSIGAADRVELRGYLPYHRVAEELRHASVALLPLPDEPVARYFTSPLKLFDYMAAGVPIVASDLPALREVLRHEENALLAEAGNADAFAAAIRRLLTDPALADRLGGRPAPTSSATPGTRAPRPCSTSSAAQAVGAWRDDAAQGADRHLGASARQRLGPLQSGPDSRPAGARRRTDDPFRAARARPRSRGAGSSPA